MIEMNEEQVDYAADPGPYVAHHKLQFAKDDQIVNHEAGKYSRGRRVGGEGVG